MIFKSSRTVKQCTTYYKVPLTCMYNVCFEMVVVFVTLTLACNGVVIFDNNISLIAAVWSCLLC